METLLCQNNAMLMGQTEHHSKFHKPVELLLLGQKKSYRVVCEIFWQWKGAILPLISLVSRQYPLCMIISPRGVDSEYQFTHG